MIRSKFHVAIDNASEDPAVLKTMHYSHYTKTWIVNLPFLTQIDIKFSRYKEYFLVFFELLVFYT